MKAKQNSRQYRWLLGSLCVWLLCAWMAQKPKPAKKAYSKAISVQTVHRSVTKQSLKPLVSAQTGKPVADTGVVKLDPETGLAFDKDLLLVKGQCTVCHSSKLILQSHFDREKWIERIRWMQRTQKLWDLGQTEPAVLMYLTKYYGPVKTPFDGRRLPLSAPTWYKAAGR